MCEIYIFQKGKFKEKQQVVKLPLQISNENSNSTLKHLKLKANYKLDVKFRLNRK